MSIWDDDLYLAKCAKEDEMCNLAESEGFKFKPGPWHHRTFKDVFMVILERVEINAKYTRLRVEWWNRGQMGIEYPLGVRQTIRIKDIHYKDWFAGKGEDRGR